MTGLAEYAVSVAQRLEVEAADGEIFAKVLTENDDSGRHGVHVPQELYSYFPDLPIPDPSRNETVRFEAIDLLTGKKSSLSWKYYERYPERRITRLNAALSNRQHGNRLVIFHRFKIDSTAHLYAVDIVLESEQERYQKLLSVLFGEGVPSGPGAFVRLSSLAPSFRPDEPLQELLSRFDEIHDRGWITTLRPGDTGIGYTFESLLGVEENNRQDADFRGIEVKCKRKKEVGLASSKLNLFQCGPNWIDGRRGFDRLRRYGQKDDRDRLSCYSQVTVTTNNIGLVLELRSPPDNIQLHDSSENIGFWRYETLEKRLKEKHSRAAFVKAAVQGGGSSEKFRYEELVYCERPTLDSFVRMVSNKEIVFELLWTEKPPGKLRNHGYPWRLHREALLDQLFSTQVRLR